MVVRRGGSETGRVLAQRINVVFSQSPAVALCLGLVVFLPMMVMLV